MSRLVHGCTWEVSKLATLKSTHACFTQNPHAYFIAFSLESGDSIAYPQSLISMSSFSPSTGYDHAQHPVVHVVHTWDVVSLLRP
jgi:hypothetical protein